MQLYFLSSRSPNISRQKSSCQSAAAAEGIRPARGESLRDKSFPLSFSNPTYPLITFSFEQS